MSRPRFDRLAGDRRQKLLDSAAEEFAAHGFEGASLNRILDRSGMGKSSLYYYFDDKADLFTTLVERALALLFRQTGGLDLDALTAESFWPDCEALYRRALAVFGSDSWYVKLGRMFYRLRGEARHPGPTDRIVLLARRWLAATLARGQDLGTIRTDLPPDLLIDCAMGLGEALDRWVVANWDALDGPARDRMAAEHIALFRRLLAP